MTLETLSLFENVGLNYKGSCELHFFWNMSDDDVNEKYLQEFEDYDPKEPYSLPSKVEDMFAPVKQEAEALVASSSAKPKALALATYSSTEGPLEWNENVYFEEALDRFVSDGAPSTSDFFSTSKWEGSNGDSRSMESYTLNKSAHGADGSPSRSVRRAAPGEVQPYGMAAGYNPSPVPVAAQLNATASQPIPSAATKIRKAAESQAIPARRKRRRTPPSSPTMKKRSKTLSSKYRGVSKCSKDGRWQARIRIGAVVKYLGRFKSEIEAAKRYDIAAHKLHGERAMPNFAPDGTPNIRTMAQGVVTDQSSSATSAVADRDSAHDTVGAVVSGEES